MENNWIENILSEYKLWNERLDEKRVCGDYDEQAKCTAVLVTLDHIAYKCGYQIVCTYDGEWTMIRS